MGAKAGKGAAARTLCRWGFLAGVIAMSAGILASCSNSPTNPPSPPDDRSTLLLDKLLVSVVPGGTETITISAAANDGTPACISLVNDEPGIVGAALADSVLTVTGLALGTANVTITSAAGKTRELPVQVYSPHVLDIGDMYVTYTDTFEFVSFHTYRPIPPEGYYALGQMFGPMMPWEPNTLRGRFAVPVVKPKPGSDAIFFTQDFSGPGHPYAVAWTPVAPAGYVAVGTWIEADFIPPASAVCIREDLTTTAPVGTSMASLDIVSPADYWLHYYTIESPDAGPHPGAYLTAGTFVNTVNNDVPAADHPAFHILDIELPTLTVVGDQEVVPHLTGYETPPEFTRPTMARAVLVPCSIINDPQFADNYSWRVANSPFYRLERQVLFKRIYHNRNNTSTEQTNSVLIRSGITITESERVWSETQISVTAELGLSIKALSGKISCTVSRSLGYETETSISELEEREVMTSINTPPFTAVAAWQEYNRYVLYRHNGTELEPVSTWEFGIDSYVTDEFPD